MTIKRKEPRVVLSYTWYAGMHFKCPNDSKKEWCYGTVEVGEDLIGRCAICGREYIGKESG